MPVAILVLLHLLPGDPASAVTSLVLSVLTVVRGPIFAVPRL